MRALVVVAMVAGLPGCAMWDAFARFWGFGERPKIVRSPGAWVEGAVPGNRVIVDNTPKAKVHLYKFSMPVGTVSGNEKVWRQLDEDALDSQTAVMLAQNGMRAGVGPVGRWPGISKLVDVPGAASEEFMCQTDGRSNVNVVVHGGVADQIIVSIDRDNVQQGRTFERCDNAFRLSMGLVKNKPDLMIQLEPIVQLGTVQVTREMGAGGGMAMGVVRSGIPQEITFSDMRLWTTVKPDQFLVVAPADPKANRFSIGTRFLGDNDTVPPRETVLVFVPMTEAGKK